MRKKTIAAVFLILAVFILAANPSFGRGILDQVDGFRPAVDLLYPVTHDIDLTGKATLQFRWRQTDLAQTGHYEFRLYKGYDTLESTMILKRDISRDALPFELPAGNFESNQVYTWSLRQVYLSGAKNDIAQSSFKIINK